MLWRHPIRTPPLYFGSLCWNSAFIFICAVHHGALLWGYLSISTTIQRLLCIYLRIAVPCQYAITIIQLPFTIMFASRAIYGANWSMCWKSETIMICVMNSENRFYITLHDSRELAACDRSDTHVVLFFLFSNYPLATKEMCNFVTIY